MKNKIIYIYLAILLGFTGCTKDASLQPKEYPYVVTKSVSNIDATGATFEADIIDYGTEKIDDFGFIFEADQIGTRYSIRKKTTLNDFKVRLESDLVKGKTYTCRAYASTSKHLILGNIILFESLGSQPPIATDFNPKEGCDGVLVKLTGKYFSLTTSNNKVYVNNLEAKVIYTTEDTIVFKTPQMTFIGDAIVSVKVRASLITLNTKFKILGPTLESFSSLSGHPGEYITINGKNLTKSGSNIDVYFGSQIASIVSSSETKIEFIVPLSYSPFNDILNTVKLINGLKSVSYKESFRITKTWERKQTLPFESRNKCKAFTYNGNGYILDGKTLYEYNSELNQWKMLSSGIFPGDGCQGSLYIVNGNILFKLGGYINDQLISDLWAFDFNSNTWLKKSDLPFKFLNAVYFNLNNQIFIIADDKQVWKCDLLSEQYTRLNDFPGNFIRNNSDFASAFVNNSKAFVVTYGKTLQYDEQSDTWIVKSANPFKAESNSEKALGFCLNNTGYVLQAGRQVYKYDFINDKWILTSAYPDYAYSYKTVFVVGDKAFVAAISSFAGASCLFSYRE